MSSDKKLLNAHGPDSARAVRRLAPMQRGPALTLAEPPKAQTAQRGSDPYNSSGSFDRTKNWASVGKR